MSHANFTWQNYLEYGYHTVPFEYFTQVKKISKLFHYYIN